MKRNIILSLIISSVINLVGMLINFISFNNSGHMPLAIKIPGGECLLELGFGLRAFHTYAMRMGDSDSVSFSFAPITLIVQILLIALIVFIIITIIKKAKEKAV